MGTNNHGISKLWVLFLILWLVPAVIVFVTTVVLPLGVDPLPSTTLETVSRGLPAKKGEGTKKKATPGVSARDTVKEQPAKTAERAELKNGPWRPLYDSLMELKLQELFLQNRLELAKSDSIGLVVALIDSSINLEIKGVIVRSTKISGFEVSGTIEKMRDKQRLAEWLAGPFMLMEETATVPKAPVKIKEAPEDTIEAEMTSSIDTTAMPSEFHDIHFRMLFDRHLVVTVHQSQVSSFQERWRKWKYDGNFLLRRAREAVSGVFGSKASDPDLYIDLALTREDCKAIYRALPENTKLALRL